MATSAERHKTSLLDLNFSPSVRSAIVLPQVIQLAIIVILTTKHVEFVVVDAGGARGADLWLVLIAGALLEDLPTDGLSVGHGELGELVDSRAVDKAAKDQERPITQVAHDMVITGCNLLRLILPSQKREW